jgi:putative sigma-54 modulation protein
MQIQITGRHMDLSEALKSRVEKELRQFERFFENIVYAHVRFDEDKQGNSVTLEVKVHGDVLTISSKGANPFAALEEATDRMKRQIKEYSSKLKERKRKATSTQQAVDEMQPPDVEE